MLLLMYRPLAPLCLTISALSLLFISSPSI